jgi:hypothetical protein
MGRGKVTILKICQKIVFFLVQSDLRSNYLMDSNLLFNHNLIVLEGWKCCTPAHSR